MKIGIFDSGIGGLSVLNEAMQRIPGGKFVYYADEEHVPYGEKTEEQIYGFVDEIVEFLIKKKVDAIVIACNTATSVAVKRLREKYTLPIIGMEPAVKRALDLYGERRVLVTATPITVKGKSMQNLIEKVDTGHLVDLVALPGLVRFAEQGQFDSEAVYTYLEETLGIFDLQEYSSLVLGCTHFSYFKKVFRDILPEQMHLVDGNEGTVLQLLRRLREQKEEEVQQAIKENIAPLEEGERTEFFISGRLATPVQKKEIQERLFHLKKMQEID